jgi:hypothetical protein
VVTNTAEKSQINHTQKKSYQFPYSIHSTAAQKSDFHQNKKAIFPKLRPAKTPKTQKELSLLLAFLFL